MATDDSAVTARGQTRDAVSELRAVNAELRSTVQRLRRNLEECAASRETAVQQVRSEHANQLVQLRSTIREMREKLGSEAHAAASARQALAADAKAKVDQLQATIQDLRLQLETVRDEALHSAIESKRTFDRETVLLRQQIVALREQLEALQ